MESQGEPQLQSIRSSERNYQREIRPVYKQHPHLFVTHSSDSLHLAIAQKELLGSTYNSLVAKTGYQKYDIIAEVRGSVIRYDKLRALIEGKVVDKSRLPLLLYLNAETKYLLSPKNITRYLFGHPGYRLNIGKYEGEWKQQSNCYIESHFGFKLLVTASRDIAAGEELVLEQRSYDNLVYHYNSLEF